MVHTWGSKLLSDFNKLQNHSPNKPFFPECVIKEKSKTKIEGNVSEVPILLFWVLLHVHTINPSPVKMSIATYRNVFFSHSQLWAIIAVSSWFFWICTQIGGEFCNRGEILAALAPLLAIPKSTNLKLAWVRQQVLQLRRYLARRHTWRFRNSQNPTTLQQMY